MPACGSLLCTVPHDMWAKPSRSLIIYAHGDVANPSDFRRDDRSVSNYAHGGAPTFVDFERRTTRGSLASFGAGQTLRRTTHGSITTFVLGRTVSKSDSSTQFRGTRACGLGHTGGDSKVRVAALSDVTVPTSENCSLPSSESHGIGNKTLASISRIPLRIVTSRVSVSCITRKTRGGRVVGSAMEFSSLHVVAPSSVESLQGHATSSAAAFFISPDEVKKKSRHV